LIDTYIFQFGLLVQKLKISCHKLVADKLVATLKILAVYWNKEIKALQLDDFGGCFNYRKMRGGTN
jgi:hypothetical protein